MFQKETGEIKDSSRVLFKDPWRLELGGLSTPHLKLGSGISFMLTSTGKLFELVFYCSVTKYPKTNLVT